VRGRSWRVGSADGLAAYVARAAVVAVAALLGTTPAIAADEVTVERFALRSACASNQPSLLFALRPRR
jgi:hypothetical protein